MKKKARLAALFWRRERGSIVLEAALVMPFFIAFMLLLIVFIRLSLAEMALQSAVSEATKVMAANMYPVKLLADEAKTRWDNSKLGQWVNGAVNQVEGVRQQAVDAEAFVEQYERWIPEPLVQLMAWEKERREQLETFGTEATDEAKRQAAAKIAEAATPIVATFADQKRLDPKKLKVTDMTFPDLIGDGDAFVGMEAQYEFTFNVPFFRKTVLLKKRALERAWVGGG